MIAKHIPMQCPGRSSFATLITYLTGPQEKEARVGIVRVTNCRSEHPEIAMLDVLNTQRFNTRSQADKTYHLIVSFPHGEAPSDTVLADIEERLCTGLGLGEHQRISVAHHDTDNLHMHIAINKIHPERFTIHTPFNDFHTLGKLCTALEEEHGLKQDNHKATKTISENLANDMEHHAGIESLLGWIKRECKEKIQQAQSWQALHQVLQDHGLHMHERANGLVITADNGVSVKASAVARECSKKQLEARLGTFTARTVPVHPVRARKQYDRRPTTTRVNTIDLFARYKAAQQSAASDKAKEISSALARKTRMIETVKRTAKLKRAALALVSAPRMAKKLMYASATRVQDDDIDAIRRQYLRTRQHLEEKHRKHAWIDWLRKEATAGNQTALAALRARDWGATLTGDTLGTHEKREGTPQVGKFDSITKHGTIIYRNGAGTIADDGAKLKVSHSADRVCIEAALKMAVHRYGRSIRIEGSEEFKENILRVAAAIGLEVCFSDETLELRRQQLAKVTSPPSKSNANRTNDFDGSPDRNPPNADERFKQAEAAAAKYIAEREQKRKLGLQVLKHVGFTGTNDILVTYGGSRTVDGHALALYKCGNEVIVLPINHADEVRLKQVPIGRPLKLTIDGRIKKQARTL